MITLLLVVTSAFAFTPAELKPVLCPFNEKGASSKFEAEYREHGAVEDVHRLLLDYQKQFGKCLDVKGNGETFELEYKAARVPFEAIEGGQNQIKSLFFGMPSLKDDSPAKVTADLKKFSWASSFYVGTADGKEEISFEPGKSLNVSRSNQIFLLKAVRDSEMKLSEVIPLDDKLFVRSFGLLHNWNPGTLLTLDSLLSLMVSEKDLTASDVVLSRLKALNAIDKNFLSYREYSLLASMPKEKLAGGIEKLLPSLKGLPAAENLHFDRVELASTLGWFSSTKDLCDAALKVKDDLVNRNIHLNSEYKSVQPREVDQFALVQSRDSGVSQLTMVFTLKGSSNWHCLALTANHSDEIEEGSFSSFGARLTNLIAHSLLK